MTDLLTQLPPDPIYDRRKQIQERAAKTIGRRTLISRVYISTLMGCFIFALIPLGSVIYALINKGIAAISWTFLTSLPTQPNLMQQDAIGGIGNAILGTIIIDLLAGLVAVPIGVLLGLYLAEATSRVADFLRAITEIMTGIPSILLGVFAYEYVVVPTKQFSGLAGIVALGVLMVPVIAKASEIAFRGVPSTLREAGLALGARDSKIAKSITLPVAAPGVITGVLLSLARAMGETAPILLVVGASGAWNFNPLQPISALPLLTYNYSGSQYPSQRAAAWGVALALVTMILILSLTARIVSARMRREKR
jgi:phosphate transport system permease protein